VKENAENAEKNTKDTANNEKEGERRKTDLHLDLKTAIAKKTEKLTTRF
jgi:hypothetical protein